MQHLYNLVHVDLSYNCLQVLEAAHTRLGNIKTLSLAGNQLQQLSGLTKLYSLVNLDLSHNQLDQVRTPGRPETRSESNIKTDSFFLYLIVRVQKMHLRPE